MALRDEKQYRTPIGRAATAAVNAIRKLTVQLTTRGLWNVLGLDDGDADQDVPVYSGIGFYARPPADTESEVIVAKIGGGSQKPAIIASRDEDTRKAVTEAAELAEDETIAFNSKCVLYLKADGTIEARTTGGTAVALALKSDVDTIQGELDGHSHTYIPGTLAVQLTTLNPSVTAPVGTTKLKGE